ncbi:hypothetical protein [Streptomyces sp. NPDC090994]
MTVHYEDGGVCETVLVLTSAQVELYSIQFGRIIEVGDTAREPSR